MATLEDILKVDSMSHLWKRGKVQITVGKVRFLWILLACHEQHAKRQVE